MTRDHSISAKVDNILLYIQLNLLSPMLKLKPFWKRRRAKSLPLLSIARCSARIQGQRRRLCDFYLSSLYWVHCLSEFKVSHTERLTICSMRAEKFWFFSIFSRCILWRTVSKFRDCVLSRGSGAAADNRPTMMCDDLFEGILALSETLMMMMMMFLRFEAPLTRVRS